MTRLITLALLLAGLLHLLPALGVLGSTRLAALYGIVYDDPSTLLLMRHRALLFGLLAIACLFAVWRPAWQTPVLVAALLSTAGFVLLSLGQGPYTPAVQRVVIIDIAAAALLLPALLIRLAQSSALR